MCSAGAELKLLTGVHGWGDLGDFLAIGDGGVDSCIGSAYAQRVLDLCIPLGRHPGLLLGIGPARFSISPAFARHVSIPWWYP